MRKADRLSRDMKARQDDLLPTTEANAVTLFGGYRANLCNDCANEWTRLLHASPLWLQAMAGDLRWQIDARLILGDPGSAADLRAKVMVDQAREAMAMAEKWMEGA